MTSIENAKNPIKEIIFRISFAKNLDLEKLEEFCNHSVIAKDFPKYNQGFEAKFTTGDKPSSEFKHAGYILKSEKSQMILNIKLGRIALHIINRYEPFPAILENLDSYWNALQDIFGEVPVTHVAVRYINQIQIAKGEYYEDCINVILKSPFNTIKKPFVKFELHPDEKKENIKTDVIVAVDGQKSIILDINVHKTMTAEELKNISDVLIDLRPIKNQVFQSLITTKTKQRFQL